MDAQQVQQRAKKEVPCAGCRLLHRKCGQDCMLAPYFPADEAEKFAIVHKVFGAGNTVKMLQMVDEAWREDAVKSMVYEAYARLKNPVYGCTIAISYLQKCVEELEEQLKATRKQILEIQEQMAQLSVVLDSIYPPVSHTDNRTIQDDSFTFPMDYCEMI